MEEDKKKKLINETITGRKMTPGRVLKLALAAGICGVVFGTVSAFTFGYINNRLESRAALNESTAPETESELSSAESSAEAAGSSAAGTEPGSAAGTKPGSEAGTTAASETGSAGSSEDAAGPGLTDAAAESAAAEGTGTESSGTESSGAESSGAASSEAESSGSTGSSESESQGSAASSGKDGKDETAADGKTEKEGTENGGKDKDGGNDESGKAENESSAGIETETAVPDPAELLRDPAFKDTFLSVLSESASYADRYLVSVTATSQEPSWFDTSMESSQTYSGVIISADKNEILILTTCTDIEQKSFKVIFRNGSTADAQFKQSSVTDGLAVFAVSASSGISEETLASIDPAEFGDTSLLKNGSPIIAVGAPMSIAGSCDFGNIGYIDPAEPAIDCSQEIFYSDICSNSEMGTFIIDPEGRLIGLASRETDESDAAAKLTRIISINSLDRVIRALSQGEKKAFLGVSGVSVDFNMKYSNVPEGVYVSNVIPDSPAYTAGIRRGDVIINVTDSISERHITDVDVLTRAVNSAKPGQAVTITIMRSSSGTEYREMNFGIVFGER